MKQNKKQKEINPIIIGGQPFLFPKSAWIMLGFIAIVLIGIIFIFPNSTQISVFVRNTRMSDINFLLIFKIISVVYIFSFLFSIKIKNPILKKYNDKIFWYSGLYLIINVIIILWRMF